MWILDNYNERIGWKFCFPPLSDRRKEKNHTTYNLQKNDERIKTSPLSITLFYT